MQHNVKDSIKVIMNREDKNVWGDGRKYYTIMKTSADFTTLFFLLSF